ncbi:hypothetical protein CBS101457_002116 [Exobasidium rhododendri]|nr:hypothetical protein CBS101457_002116 [Exobasidium rhododendri]
MSTRSEVCNDASFGPTSTCRFFDFTLTFQNYALIIPSALLIVMSTLHITSMVTGPTVIQKSRSFSSQSRAWRQLDLMGFARLSLASVHAVITMIVLILVAHDEALERPLMTSTIIPALSLSMVSALLIIPLSYMDRLRRPSGSALLPLYLFAASLIDACRVRTYLGVPILRHSSYGRLTIAVLTLKILMLAAENTTGVQTMQSTKEDSATFLSKMLFWWLKDVIWAGYRKPLSMTNLQSLGPNYEGGMLGSRLARVWFAERSARDDSAFIAQIKAVFKKKQVLLRRTSQSAMESIELHQLNHSPSLVRGEANASTRRVQKVNLLWVCFKAFPLALLAPVIPKICMSGVSLALPFMIKNTLAFAESHIEPNVAQPTVYGWGLVGAYGFVYLVLAFSTGQFFWACDKSQVKLRGALLDMIYRKSLRMHLNTARATGGGAAANLMSVDLERFVRAIIPFHNLWSGLLVVIISSYLLYLQLGYTFLATLVSLLMCLFFPPIASRGIGTKQSNWSKLTDKRVDLTSSAISNAKGVKYMAYENIIVEKLIEARRLELKACWTYYTQLLLISSFTNLVTEIMALSTFTTLAIVDYLSGSHRFTITTVVTSLTLMQLLEAPLNQMGQNYGSIIAALVSLRRMQKFLLEDEQPSFSTSAPPSRHATDSGDDKARSRSMSNVGVDTADDQIAACFESVTLGWSTSKPVLLNVTLTIPRNRLTMICGSLASGKSTLLQSLLGETNTLSGNLYLPMKKEPIAYVAQDGWLQEGATIRENIVFDSEFNAQLYQKVINATALHIDFGELPAKDESLAKALSGGQRQRVTLARALYSEADTYVLDDFTSALDAATAGHVWKSLMGKDGMLRDKTVIMATNALQLLHHASLIVRLDNGKVIESGSFQELSERSKESIARSSMQSERPDDQEEVRKEVQVVSKEKEDDKHEEIEQGTIKWSVYGHWIKAIGYFFVFWGLAGNMLLTAALMGWNTYLQYWVRSVTNDEQILNKMGGFIALVLTTMALLPATIYVFFYGMLVNAGTRLHTAELMGVFGTSLSFFENNASGRIINRFSQDLFVLDWEIVLALGNFVASILRLVAQLVVLVIPVPYLTVVILVVCLLYVGIQRLYAPISRQLRRLEMATKSPIYTLFSETSTPAGLATIRALNRQQLFVEMNLGRLNRSQQPYFYLQAVRRWLQTSLNLLSLLINVALIAIVVLLRNTNSIGILGVGLVQATNISMDLNQSLISYTELEIASIALERVLGFAKLPKEQEDSIDGVPRVKIAPDDVKGVIEFKNVDVSYKSGLKPALEGINIKIRSGEKLGICGRSGSGKSTMLLAIFAMLEVTQGDGSGDVYIDNRAISKTSAFSLRNSLTIVPQNALILTATIRENLDPSEEKSDVELWNALEVCKLLDIVKNFPDGLSTMLANDINLSSGQRQLFSLARALLRNRKVLVLDEATSSMDYDTDAAVQQVLRTQFNNCTIITVAHRIATVRDYDRILVLSAGRIAELDTPDALMRQSNSIFRSLAQEQGIL